MFTSFQFTNAVIYDVSDTDDIIVMFFKAALVVCMILLLVLILFMINFMINLIVMSLTMR